MGTSGLPDIYTRSPRAEGVYIRRTMSAHGITAICHLALIVLVRGQVQYDNGFIVFIVAPIAFDYGFEIECLYYVLTYHE